MIRPDARTFLHRQREVIGAALLAGVGLWLIWLGGLVLIPLGLALIGLAGALALTALRRLRFGRGGGAPGLVPGLVEVDEGQIAYLGPETTEIPGGFVSLPDLVEIRLITLGGRRMWRLKQADGQALLVPVDATGSEGLFDAFSTLPGMDTGALVQALSQTVPEGSGALALRPVWRHPRHSGRIGHTPHP